MDAFLYIRYRSSLKYEVLSEAGGWFSRFFRIVMMTSTRIVAAYGTISSSWEGMVNCSPNSEIATFCSL